jgi:phage repressor protein C with HTH and peptisase S24 domain
MHSEFGQLSGEFLDAAVDLMGRAGRGGTVRVRGRSMVPTLTEGQLLAIEFSPDRLSRGDMLVYRQEGLLMVHRLLGHARTPDGRPS